MTGIRLQTHVDQTPVSFPSATLADFPEGLVSPAVQPGCRSLLGRDRRQPGRQENQRASQPPAVHLECRDARQYLITGQRSLYSSPRPTRLPLPESIPAVRKPSFERDQPLRLLDPPELRTARLSPRLEHRGH